jgi:hypothetical protein
VGTLGQIGSGKAARTPGILLNAKFWRLWASQNRVSEISQSEKRFGV